MRENSKVSLPTIECDEKTFAWLTQLPVDRINKANLNWRKFLIVHKLLNKTVLVAVSFDAMTAKIKVYYNLKNGKNSTYKIPKQPPTCEANVKFVLDRVCIERMQGKRTTETMSLIQNRIVPILRFLLSSEKYEVILKKKEVRNKNSASEPEVYRFVRTVTAFGETFEFQEELCMKSERELLRSGVVVSASAEAYQWLEDTADYVREKEKENQERKKANEEIHQSPVFDQSRDRLAIKAVSAIRVYDDSGDFQLQLRHKNDVVEIAYFERGCKCQILMYSDSSSNFKTADVIYGDHDPKFTEYAKKVIAVLQNVLVYLRVWDLGVAQKEDKTWRVCEVSPWL